MLTDMVKKHTAKQQIFKEIQEKKKNEAVVAAHSLSDAIVEHLNKNVSQAYLNQKKIDAEAKRMQSYVLSLTKISDKLTAIVDSFNVTLKVGDVESWANAIDNDLSLLLDTFQEVYDEKLKLPTDETK